jgi:hypothetical protein
VATIGCGGQGPAAEALAVSTCLYQIEFSDQFQGLFAKLFLQKKTVANLCGGQPFFPFLQLETLGCFVR